MSIYEPNTKENRKRLMDSFAQLQSAQILILKENVSLNDIKDAVRFTRNACSLLTAIEQSMSQQKEPIND